MTAAPPRLLVLTDRRRCEAAGHSLQWVIAAAAGAGARCFVFREKDLPPTERRALAADCLAVAGATGAELAIASDLALASALGGLAVHLAATDPDPPPGVRHGRSCHNQAELEHALRNGAAYATVSPVFTSAAKPGYGPALGVDGLGRLVHVAGEMPVLALGGVTPDNSEACLRGGASGVAVMSSVMGSPDPGTVVSQLLVSIRAVPVRRHE